MMRLISKISVRDNEFPTLVALLDKENSIVFDVGGHQGEYTAEFLHGLKTPEIYIFEPSPENTAILKNKFSAYKNIHVENYGISDVRGEKEFYFANDTAKINSLYKHNLQSDFAFSPKKFTNMQSMKLPFDTIDNVIERYGIEHIDILKIDVEAHEYEALCGASHALSNNMIDYVYVELFIGKCYQKKINASNHLAKIFDFMDQKDYELFNFFDIIRAKNSMCIAINALFIKRSKFSEAVALLKTAKQPLPVHTVSISWYHVDILKKIRNFLD